MEILEGLTFDDVLLVPQYSEVKSRSHVDLSVKIGKLEFKHPIIPANMQTVTGLEMADAVVESGGLAILHRFMPTEEQISIAEDMCDFGNDHRLQRFAVSVGVKRDDVENLEKFQEAGVRIVCVDIAHGNSRHCVDMIRNIKEVHSNMTVIAGNVATGDGARRLWEAGADIVKVGVGPGSLCTTRIETGNGVPQLTALMDVQKAQQELLARDRATRYPDELRPYPFIADGGIKSAGDVVKALCFADMVMMGNVFAGCVEAPGEVHYFQGVPHKEYRGSSTHKTNHIEGVAAWVPCTGTYQVVLTKLLEGLRSGCSYQGVNSLSELKDNPTFIRITSAGLRESHPHDVITK
jgi:IMP dehydrogenase